MGALLDPAASSACRMAATRPSIMSEGATISTPARTSDTAVLARISSVSSLAISNSCAIASAAAAVAACADFATTTRGPGGLCLVLLRTTPQCPCDMYSHRHTSPIIISSGSSRFSARAACCTIPFSSHAPVAASSFFSGRPNKITAGMPSPCASRASFTSSSTERFATPGIDETGLRTPLPGQANKG